MNGFTGPAIYNNPAVRHLAWLSQAPALIRSSSLFSPASILPADFGELLSCWDAHPERRPPELNQTPHYRLGLYVEDLYTCLLRDVLGWKILARNLPVRHEGVTLGELDFVVRNPATGMNEHHEIAIKFYLGYPPPTVDGGATLWYGPNSRDRLDIKASRMIDQQSQRTRLTETRTVLRELGIEAPFARRIFMPGYLFYPSHAQLPSPAIANTGHLRGDWLYLPQATTRLIQDWAPLQKPHWLGPWMQAQRPDAQAVANALEDVQHSGTPRLFASLVYDETLECWREANRCFVVPESWPGSGRLVHDSSITTLNI